MLGVPLALGRIGPAGPAPARGAARRRARRRRRTPPRAVRRARARADRHARRRAAPRLLDARAARPRPQGGRAALRHRRPRSRADPRRPDLRRLSHRSRRACAATRPPTSRRSPALSRMLGGAAFALARMAPRRYERLADAGAATGVIDPLLVRAYLRAGTALPAHEPGDGTPHSGAALHLFATGVAHRVVKADVASLYPSLMRAYRIGPARDRLGALLALVDRLVERRLAAKASARAAPAGSAERYTHEAMSAAMKLVVNSAYGYLAAGGGLTRFADVHAANEVTRRGREMLDLMCRELAARGVTLLEADTDGVYFAVPDDVDARRTSGASCARSRRCCRRWCSSSSRAATRRCCRTSRRTTRCSRYDGTLHAARRRVPLEPRRAVRRGVPAPRDRAAAGAATSPACARRISRRCLRCGGASCRRYDVSSRVRLTKTPARVPRERATTRRELPYEAMLASGRTTWSVGERVRVYRTRRRPAACSSETVEAAPGRRISAATTTSSTTCGCCATPSRRGSPARSRRRTSPRCSPIRISRRSSSQPSTRFAPFSPCTSRRSLRPARRPHNALVTVTLLRAQRLDDVDARGARGRHQRRQRSPRRPESPRRRRSAARPGMRTSWM